MHGCLFFLGILPFLLFGYSTEYRVNFADNEIHSTSDIYFRPFPMITHNMATSVRPIGIPIHEDDHVPLFTRHSIGYRSKGGWRIDIDKLFTVLDNDRLIDRINNDPVIRNAYIHKLRDSRNDIFEIFQSIEVLIEITDRNR